MQQDGHSCNFCVPCLHEVEECARNTLVKLVLDIHGSFRTFVPSSFDAFLLLWRITQNWTNLPDPATNEVVKKDYEDAFEACIAKFVQDIENKIFVVQNPRNMRAEYHERLRARHIAILAKLYKNWYLEGNFCEHSFDKDADLYEIEEAFVRGFEDQLVGPRLREKLGENILPRHKEIESFREFEDGVKPKRDSSSWIDSQLEE